MTPYPLIRVSVSRSLLEKWRLESYPIDRSECTLSAHVQRACSRAPSNAPLTRKPALLAILLTGTFGTLIHLLRADHLRNSLESKGLCVTGKRLTLGSTAGGRTAADRTGRWCTTSGLRQLSAPAPSYGRERASRSCVYGKPITERRRSGYSQSTLGVDSYFKRRIFEL